MPLASSSLLHLRLIPGKIAVGCENDTTGRPHCVVLRYQECDCFIIPRKSPLDEFSPPCYGCLNLHERHPRVDDITDQASFSERQHVAKHCLQPCFFSRLKPKLRPRPTQFTGVTGVTESTEGTALSRDHSAPVLDHPVRFSCLIYVLCFLTSFFSSELNITPSDHPSKHLSFKHPSLSPPPWQPAAPSKGTHERSIADPLRDGGTFSDY